MAFFFEEKSFIAVIGDVKKSRELEKRKEIQDNLKAVLDEINAVYKDDIASNFLITLGDEFQGLLFNGKNVLKMIQKIKMQLYPVELRFGIGIGSISTEINTEMALGADGPGYYNAQNAVEVLKKNEKKNKAILSDIRLEDDKGAVTQTVLINTVFELARAIEDGWTDRQREIIWDMLAHQDGQQQAADRLGIAQSSVQKSLAKGQYYTYANALKNVENILACACGSDESTDTI